MCTVAIGYVSLYVAESLLLVLFFFFFNDTATTEIYTLSLHDALPISDELAAGRVVVACPGVQQARFRVRVVEDRKSTRLNSSHLVISYAVFCLKKKKNTTLKPTPLNLRHQRKVHEFADMTRHQEDRSA